MLRSRDLGSRGRSDSGSVAVDMALADARTVGRFRGDGNAAVALACLAHSGPLPALIGCVAFATFGAYIALFHTTSNMALPLAIGAWREQWRALSCAPIAVR